MTGLRRRPATPEDSEWVYELHRAALGPSIEATFGPWNDEVQRSHHERWFDAARLEVLLVGDEEVGVLDSGIRDDGVHYLSRIELWPRWQGRGIGAAVIRRLVEEARAAGASAVELDVFVANTAAERFYARLGFVVVGRHGHKRRMRLTLS